MLLTSGTQTHHCLASVVLLRQLLLTLRTKLVCCAKSELSALQASALVELLCLLSHLLRVLESLGAQVGDHAAGLVAVFLIGQCLCHAVT